jgi:hypothetical protein
MFIYKLLSYTLFAVTHVVSRSFAHRHSVHVTLESHVINHVTSVVWYDAFPVALHLLFVPYCALLFYLSLHGVLKTLKFFVLLSNKIVTWNNKVLDVFRTIKRVTRKCRCRWNYDHLYIWSAPLKTPIMGLAPSFLQNNCACALCMWSLKQRHLLPVWDERGVTIEKGREERVRLNHYLLLSSSTHLHILLVSSISGNSVKRFRAVLMLREEAEEACSLEEDDTTCILWDCVLKAIL